MGSLCMEYCYCSLRRSRSVLGFLSILLHNAIVIFGRNIPYYVPSGRVWIRWFYFDELDRQRRGFLVISVLSVLSKIRPSFFRSHRRTCKTICYEITHAHTPSRYKQAKWHEVYHTDTLQFDYNGKNNPCWWIRAVYWYWINGIIIRVYAVALTIPVCPCLRICLSPLVLTGNPFDPTRPLALPLSLYGYLVRSYRPIHATLLFCNLVGAQWQAADTNNRITFQNDI